MLDTILQRLRALRDVITDPAIPDAIDRGADLLHDLADLLRGLQAGPVFAAGSDDEQKLTECQEECKELLKLAKPKPVGKGRPKKAVGATAAAAIDPATLLMLLQLARQLLDLWRKRREAA
jgi:hypothetical protein